MRHGLNILPDKTSPFPKQALVFTDLQRKSFWKHCGKRGNYSERAISPFPHSVSYLFEELSAIFIKLRFVVCKRFEFGRVQNLSLMWQRPICMKSVLSNNLLNRLPHMPILGSSNATAKKDMMSKIWTNGDTTIFSNKHCRKKKKLHVASNFFLFPHCFQKLSVVDVSKWVSVQ